MGHSDGSGYRCRYNLAVCPPIDQEDTKLVSEKARKGLEQAPLPGSMWARRSGIGPRRVRRSSLRVSERKLKLRRFLEFIGSV
jgi:hypothetical protein